MNPLIARGVVFILVLMAVAVLGPINAGWVYQWFPPAAHFLFFFPQYAFVPNGFAFHSDFTQQHLGGSSTYIACAVWLAASVAYGVTTRRVRLVYAGLLALPAQMTLTFLIHYLLHLGGVDLFLDGP